ETYAARIIAIEHAERSAGLERKEAAHLPAAQNPPYRALLGPVHRQFEHAVQAHALRAVVGGPAALAAPIVGVLREGDLARGRWIEHLGRAVDERAPGVVCAHAEAAGEPFLEAGLPGVVDR